MKALGIRNVLDFEFISPPTEENVVKSLELLFALGALDERTELTKEIGYKLVEFPLDPKLGTVLLNSNREEYKCMEEMLNLVSILSVQNLFLGSKEPTLIAKAKKKDVGVIEGDHLTLLNAYKVYNRIKLLKKREQFCYEHSINEKAMIRAVQIRSQLRSMVRQLKIDIKSSDDYDDYESILKCVTGGYFTHVAQLQTDGSYRNIRNNALLYIHPSSVLANLRPRWVVYHEIVATKYQYMREVSEINPEWLLELAPHYFVDRRKEELEEKHIKEATRVIPPKPTHTSERPMFGTRKRMFRNAFQQFSTEKPQDTEKPIKKQVVKNKSKQNSMIEIDYDF
jgi:ATP-dependent RNA helicase DDX35